MKPELFEELTKSVREGGAILREETEPSRRFEVAPEAVQPSDVTRLRAQLGLSSSQFAALLGVSPATLRRWESGVRAPQGPARVLLRIAQTHPEALHGIK